MVTHDPHAAAIADRMLFLEDGQIVRDLAGADEDDIIAAMKELAHVIRVALRGLALAQAALGAHGDGDRARRGAGERHLRAHRLDHEGVRLDLPDDLPGTDATITGRNALDSGANDVRRQRRHPVVRPVAARAGARRCLSVKDAIGGVAGEPQLVKNGKAISFGGAPNLGFSVDPTRTAVRVARS